MVKITFLIFLCLIVGASLIWFCQLCNINLLIQVLWTLLHKSDKGYWYNRISFDINVERKLYLLLQRRDECHSMKLWEIFWIKENNSVDQRWFFNQEMWQINLITNFIKKEDTHKYILQKHIRYQSSLEATGALAYRWYCHLYCITKQPAKQKWPPGGHIWKEVFPRFLGAPIKFFTCCMYWISQNTCCILHAK